MSLNKYESSNLLKIQKLNGELEEANDSSKPLFQKVSGIVVTEVCQFVFQDFPYKPRKEKKVIKPNRNMLQRLVTKDGHLRLKYAGLKKLRRQRTKDGFTSC